jgi:RNA polymerase sigma-70 factor (ECF subfamily)
MPTPVADPLLELLRASALGDQIAFAELYRATSSRLFAIASRMLGRADSASDALQESYIRIWTQSGQYHVEKGQPIHWMAGIVRHVCIDMRRRSASQRVPGPDLEAIANVPLDDIASVDLKRCLEKLDAAQFKAILMAFHFGLSHSELAKTFAVPLGTMKSTIRRGLIRLKECLDAGDSGG